jgi:hypothetical protein
MRGVVSANRPAVVGEPANTTKPYGFVELS